MTSHERPIPTRWSVTFANIALLVIATSLSARAAEPDSVGLTLFEKRIRPLLVEHCYECHSAGKKIKGGLRLDHREAWVKGGDSGAAIVPGKPEESLLIEALRHEASLKMPPKGKLPDAAIRDFEQWVKLGAPDPRRADDGKADSSAEIDIEGGRRHWSYRPVAKAPPPNVRDTTWPETEIDRFILSRLEARGLTPVADAAPETLVRRLYFDLIGLPPTPEQIDMFLADRSPEAWERLVDRLLASPQFGERWGRHWLDVVRFGESLTLRGFILKEAWRYRDYVIESFDIDVPYNEFVREQIAGDLLSAVHATGRAASSSPSPPGGGRAGVGGANVSVRQPAKLATDPASNRASSPAVTLIPAPSPVEGEGRNPAAVESPGRSASSLLAADQLKLRQRRLVATTMLMLGNTNLEEQDKPQLEMDLIDEQLDVIGRGFLAQTITCARCHDHKFDPIPARDYYALAGILKNAKTLDHENISKWVEVPLPLEPEQEAVFAGRDRELVALQTGLDGVRAALKKATAPTTPIATIVAVKDLPGVVVDDADAKQVGTWKHSKSIRTYVGDGYLHDLDEAKGDKTLTFDPELPETGTYEVRLAYTPGENRAAKVPVTVFSADGEKTIDVNERETPPIEGRFTSLGQYRFERGGQSFVIVANTGTKGHVVADAIQFLPTGEVAATAANAAEKKPPEKSVPESDEVKALREEVKRREGELKKFKASGPMRPMVISVAEKAKPEDLFIHLRGSVHNRGPIVPRGFLQVATPASSPDSPTIPADSGGRLELANWLASADNPLTARVMVNRVWHWLFGSGLVRTTDNFGTTGEMPSHPELLDHLAATFVEDGWSVKRLIRRIALSRTYRLATTGSAEARAADPENRLLAHAHRRRLDAECLRDAMLVASDSLQWKRGGQTYPAELAADYGFSDFPAIRSVYLPVFRNTLPDLFEAFDFADPSLVTGRRNTSTVAPQALFLMNHPFVLEQSRLVAEKLLAEPHDNARLTRAYRQILGRQPTAEERTIAGRFLETATSVDSTTRAGLWQQFIQSLFATVQFRYVD